MASYQVPYQHLHGWDNHAKTQSGHPVSKVLPQNPLNTNSSRNISCTYAHSYTKPHQMVVLSTEKPDQVYMFKLNYVGKVTVKTHDKKDKSRYKFTCEF
jgi:hypothetical protein